MGALLTATALVAACGDDGDDGGAASGGAAGAGGGSGGTAGTGIIGIGGDFGQGGDGIMGQAGGCGQSPFAADPVPVNVLWVLDESASMTDNEIENGVTRWAAMLDAVEAAVSGSQDNISYGLLLYPEGGDNACGVAAGVAVDIAPASSASTDIVAALEDATPDGGTPTAQALTQALEYFTNGAGADLEGESYVLLATDGGPNCNADLSCEAAACTLNIEGKSGCTGDTNCCTGDNEQCLDDDATVAAVEALADAGIKTIVVGIPGTEDYGTLLDTLAESGGITNPDAPPSYFAVEAGSAAGLADVLESITKGLITTCEFQLQSDPPVEGLLNVYIDDELVRFDADGENGWTLDKSTDPDTVVLVGDACDAMKETGAKSVEIIYGCQTVPR